jgi:filamentous hemagglutinin
VGVSLGAQGWSINVAASRGRGWSNGWGTTYYNTELASGGELALASGRHLSLHGAQAGGGRLLARVGTLGAGDLTVASPIDDSHYKAREETVGISVSIPVPGLSTGTGYSASLSRSRRVGEAKPVDAKLPDGFPTFDYFEQSTGVATSAKTLNTTTEARMNKPEQVYYTAKQHIDNAAEFEKAERFEREVRRDQITSTVVEILVPAQTTRAQWEQLYRAVEYGKSRNVVVKITKGG